MDKSMNCVWTLTDPLRLTESGVYGVFDETNKQVWISCSNNLLKGIASVVTLIREKDHLCSNMVNPEVRVLFLGPNQRHEGTKILQRLEGEGYRSLNKYSPVLLTARVRALHMGIRLVSVVTLRSSRGSEEIIAAFSNNEDCSNWFDEFYPGGLVTEIVRLDDELTSQVKREYES
jgi:hypothetical protein